MKGIIIGMRDMGASYRQIALTVGCRAMITEQVVTRWTQDNSVARKAGKGPSRRIKPPEDRRIFRLALTNIWMITAEIRADIVGRVSLRTVGNILLEI